MFTQTAMQAFRSVFVALLIISVFPRWCAAQGDKVDASVLKAAETQSTVAVAIYLQDEPPSKQISEEVKTRFRPNIRAKSTEIRNRIRSFRRQKQVLPPNVKAEVRVMHESLETQTRQMRQEIGRRLKNHVSASQQRVRQAIENAGGTVHAQVALGNLMGAQLPATAVTQIAALDDVRRIGLDTAPVPTLNSSAQIMYAPSFWNAGYDGGIHDIGVIEYGVDNHPYLRSGSAFIKRRANNGSDHGTRVAGIIASTHSTYKGIAWGLDKLLDASFYPRFSIDAQAAMIWAVTGVADNSAAVINFSFGGVLGDDDIIGCNRTMDFGDPDYIAYQGGWYDNFIDTHNVLIVISAGNETYPDIYPPKLDYSLSWGSDSYNAIVVGASTASDNNKPRAENTVAYFSSRGPTPAGRKKPDVVAPGFRVTTTAPGGGFGSFSGTSAAAPHVSGAILLFRDYGLEHPMMQKALLINTAEDRGDAGWDKHWGWGYIDLYTALEQYDYTKIGSIDGGAEKWYSGTMNDCQTVTLVWHKYSGRLLSNLDMYLYDAGTQDLIDFSTSPRDNVEQVKLPSGDNRAVYLRIVHRGSETETFGLAAPSEFESLDEPPFTP